VGNQSERGKGINTVFYLVELNNGWKMDEYAILLGPPSKEEV
jgi:hypothetical protein